MIFWASRTRALIIGLCGFVLGFTAQVVAGADLGAWVRLLAHVAPFANFVLLLSLVDTLHDYLEFRQDAKRKDDAEGGV